MFAFIMLLSNKSKIDVLQLYDNTFEEFPEPVVKLTKLEELNVCEINTFLQMYSK